MKSDHRAWVQAGKGRNAWQRRAECRCGWRGRWYPARDTQDALQDARLHLLQKAGHVKRG